MSFPSHGYLEQHYLGLNETNKTILRFLNESLKTIPAQRRALDIGTGPTIYQLISASGVFDRIDCGEFSETNRSLIRGWKNNPSDIGFDWTDWFRFVAKLESSNPADLKKRTINTIGKIFSLNILSDQKIDRYPAVLSLFCAESIARNKQEFKSGVEFITDTVQNGGWLILGLLRGASFWPRGDQKRSCYPVYEDEVKEILNKKGFQIKNLKVNEKAEEFCDGHILLQAQRP